MRLTGLDIARFIAFTGMVLVNFRIAAQVSGTHHWAFQITHLLEGRAAALFVVLAGVGITLANAYPALMAKRALFLLAIGLLNQIIFPADILHYYGIYFLCVIPMMRLPARGLLIASALILALSFLMLIGLNYEAGWNWITYEYSDFWTVKGFIRNLFYNGWHPVFPWLTFLLYGIWLGRLNLAKPATQIKLLIGGTLLITPLLTRLHIATWLATPGRQTLTLYVAHILIGMGILEVLGKLDGSLSSPAIFTIAIAFATLTSLYAHAWSRISRRGPLEALMRKITEGQAK